MEYISRSTRADLIKRAIASDLFVKHSHADLDDTSEDILRSLAVLRVFLNRVFLYGGFTEQSVSYLWFPFSLIPLKLS
jgi:hypothetical protein